MAPPADPHSMAGSLARTASSPELLGKSLCQSEYLFRIDVSITTVFSLSSLLNFIFHAMAAICHPIPNKII
jgi:hypothetical protein